MDNLLVEKGLIYIDDKGEYIFHFYNYKTPAHLITEHITGKKCNSKVETPEKAMKIQNFISQKNAVMVVGYPKSGSHLILSILDELGKYNFCVMRKF